MIEIDGSYGEGGGQILRTAISLSSILEKSINIKNIRKNRPKPGLAIQHIKSIELAREMTDATVDGLYIGSTEIKFIPRKIKGGYYYVDIGTAGSISLLLQSVMAMAYYASSPVTFEVIGGTDVKWSPTYDYLGNVLLPALKKFNYVADLSLVSRGFYPRGGGKMILHVEPGTLKSAEFVCPEGDVVNGVSCSSKLPSHVAERQANSATKFLEQNGISVGEIKLDIRNDVSTGSSITLYKGYLGSSTLGERGLPAEKVGSEAAKKILKEIRSGAAVDSNLSDQLIQYMHLATGSSKIITSELTSHAITNMWVIEEITGKKFTVEKNGPVCIRS
ncbi:RNA 3'-terminal phosphate cyclase [Methanocella sp. CWC-04]|uniref:RNA 3'-terminal phosphate cyclase n=1 Tax=Methanooceanicella nereidis TaxID=2052831 RepID=A0AAP2W5Z5_9EURY|nr:RNA 3'-terminal phosphate cyclase [Methanocella sp. CWC-04]